MASSDGRAKANVLTTLPVAMTGRASPAKAAVGDKPVFAYISSLPQPQRSIAGTQVVVVESGDRPIVIGGGPG